MAQRGNIIDGDAAIQALQVIFRPGDVFEIRALDATTRGYNRPHTVSGYFDYEHIAMAVGTINKEITSAHGIYYTPNPVEPALLARAANRLRDMGQKDPSTADKDIPRRRWLLIDCDAVRPSGISSSDEEHQAAREKANEIRDGLASMGFPQPIEIDSGNGAQLMYSIDLPGGLDNEICEKILAQLQSCNTPQVNVDKSVFNASRIWRMPGSMNCKGDSIPGRPHRQAQIIAMPSELKTVPIELLKDLAGITEQQPPKPLDLTEYQNRPKGTGAKLGNINFAEIKETANDFDLDNWIMTYCPDAQGPEEWHGGRKWIFPICPFNPDHTNRSAVITEQADGAIGFTCHHNSCQGNDWKKLRELREPGYTEIETRQAQPGSLDTTAATPLTAEKAAFEDCNSMIDVFFHPPKKADELIEGVLRKGHKMILSGPSKAGKSFAMIQLAWALSDGNFWFDKIKCIQSPVLYLNMEIDEPSFIHRVRNVILTINQSPNEKSIANFHYKTYRGKQTSKTSIYTLKEEIITLALKYEVAAIFIDPIYKCGLVDENNADAIGRFLNTLDEIAFRTQAAIIITHHFSKGAQDNKSAIDKPSGSGVFARDPDAILTLSKLQTENAFRLEFVLREFKSPEPFSLRFEYPIHVSDDSLEEIPIESSTIKHYKEKEALEKQKEKARNSRDAEIMDKIVELAEEQSKKPLSKGNFIKVVKTRLNSGGTGKTTELVETLIAAGRLIEICQKDNNNTKIITIPS